MGTPRYLRSRHGELEPVCTSSNLSSLSAELRAQGVGAREVAPQTPCMPPFSVPGTPVLPPSLLDNGVHGCNALSHDEGLTVGDIIQGRSRVARQDDLQQTPRLLRDLGRRRAPSQTVLARPPRAVAEKQAPGHLSLLGGLWGEWPTGQDEDGPEQWGEADPSPVTHWPQPAPPHRAAASPAPTCRPKEQRQPHDRGGAGQGSHVALTLTSVPLDRSSLTKGKTPKMTSTPLLSAKIKAHL